MSISVHLKHPFTMLIAGPTGSGKTHFIRDMINKASQICDPPPKSVTYLYGEYQKMFNSMPGVKFIEGLQEEVIKGLGGVDPEWLVIDDLMSEAANQSFVSDLFTKGSHHRNISVILITQNFFMKGKETRNISLNSQYVVCFKNPRDKSIVTNIGRQMFPTKIKKFAAVYEDATQEPYSYLFIDLKPDTQEKTRLLTNIFNERDKPMYTYLL
uniref:AAA+ ATPase domain-containing protein n=2 Tax=Tetranychus urticae TaxID=32264 RepID=A0A158P4L7_TETUR